VCVCALPVPLGLAQHFLSSLAHTTPHTHQPLLHSLPSPSGGRGDKKKATSQSVKAGLTFPVARMGRFLKKGRYCKLVGKGAPVYMAAGTCKGREGGRRGSCLCVSCKGREGGRGGSCLCVSSHPLPSLPSLFPTPLP